MAPVITAKQGVTVHVGDSLNAGDLVDVRDNKDPNPVVTVEHDTSKAGEIQVTVTATDASGNSSTTVTVNVVEKEKHQ